MGVGTIYVDILGRDGNIGTYYIFWERDSYSKFFLKSSLKIPWDLRVFP